MDKLIYDTGMSLVMAPQTPHVPLSDGGHLVIYPKTRVKESFELDDVEFDDVMRTTRDVIRGMFPVMEKMGFPLYTVNVQDNGNWAFLRGEEKSFHIHIYGRAVGERYQKYGEALHFDYIDETRKLFEPVPDIAILNMLAISRPIESNGIHVSAYEDSCDVSVMFNDGNMTQSRVFNSFADAIGFADIHGASFITT